MSAEGAPSEGSRLTCAVNDNLAALFLPFARREEQEISARSSGFNRAALMRGDVSLEGRFVRECLVEDEKSQCWTTAIDIIHNRAS